MLPCVANAAGLYTITDLGTLGGPQAVALDINESGQVVGYADVYQAGGAYHAFLWDSGSMQGLGTLGGQSSTANGINDQGQIVGWANTATGTRAVLWSPAAVATELGTLGGADSYANDINNNGQIVGSAQDSDGKSRAVLWSGIGAPPIDLGTLGGTSSGVTEINDNGLAVGLSTDNVNSSGTLWDQRAFSWTAPGGMTSLASRGVSCCTANGVNDLGQIVGFNGGGFFLGATGSATSIPSLGGSGATDLTAINNLGQAVGYSSFADTYHAVLWTESNGLLDLNTAIVDLSGWSHVFAAYGINEKGQIVGMGETTGNRTHAFLLTPVPIPSAAYLFAGALGAMGWLRRTQSATS
jgi:probable HAF family extracellular repeat protein